MPFLSPNQQRPSTEGLSAPTIKKLQVLHHHEISEFSIFKVAAVHHLGFLK